MWLEEAGVTKREAFEVVLAVTEAFANAVEHPEEPRLQLVDVEGRITNHAVTISIRDSGNWDGEQTPTEEGGLGLVMMEALMDTVGFECYADGTTVTMRRRLASVET
jgi:anti-sigma regulatory factor (Ser/Thr protein kinase)